LAGTLNRIVVFECYFVSDAQMNAEVMDDCRWNFVWCGEPVQHLEQL
jgi:hypothetical protein